MKDEKELEEIQKWNREREETIKENWKELEYWKSQREEKLKEEYGVDITKLGKNNKWIDKLTKNMEKLGKALAYAICFAYIFIIVMAYVVLVSYYIGIGKQLDDSIQTKSTTIQTLP